jgi:ribosomal protein S18 acetylase RimI-like enzyme
MMHAEITIRRFADRDWDDVWAILEPIFRAGETYAYPRDISEADARRKWTSAPNEVFVAEDPRAATIVGTYFVRPNQEGQGAHVCNCGYAVSAQASGRGVASAMCEHSQGHALARGFRAMQFNLVVATNDRAVRLWTRLGFTIVGTLPGAFRHPRLGFVDAYVMFKRLAA